MQPTTTQPAIENLATSQIAQKALLESIRAKSKLIADLVVGFKNGTKKGYNSAMALQQLRKERVLLMANLVRPYLISDNPNPVKKEEEWA